MNMLSKLLGVVIIIFLASHQVFSQMQSPNIVPPEVTPPVAAVPAQAPMPASPPLAPVAPSGAGASQPAGAPATPEVTTQPAITPVAPLGAPPAASAMPVPAPPVQEPLVTAVPGLSGAPTLGGQPPAIPAQPVAPPVNLIQESQESVKEGIDTIAEEDSGNWYEKRRAWKKARPKYDEIRKLVVDVDATEKELFDKDKEFEKNLENFYHAIGLQQGEVTQILDSLIQELEKEKAKKAASQGSVNAQEKQIAEIQAKKQKDLEAVKNNIDKIKKISSNVHNSILTTFVDQIKLSKVFEDKALESYYRISEILDDRKARNLLHDMDIYSENVQAILSWISGELKNYVDQSLSKVQELIEATKKQIEELKQQGIVLKKKLSEQEKKAQEEKLKKEAEEKAKAEAEKRAKLSFWDKTKQYFISVVSSIGNFFSSVWQWLKNSFSSLMRTQKVIQPKQEPIVQDKAAAPQAQAGAAASAGTPVNVSPSLAEAIPQTQIPAGASVPPLPSTENQPQISNQASATPGGGI